LSFAECATGHIFYPEQKERQMHRRSFLLTGTAATLFATNAFAAPSAKLWDRWTRHDAGSGAKVDHSGWDALLGRYLQMGGDGVARVDYAGVKQDMGALEAYLATLEATPVSTLNRIEQMAFWVNLYNAVTVKVVVDHWPVKSIRDIDISPGLLSNGPWGADLTKVEGEALTLDDIEHRILRPIWKDPRIHYAVNCASIGCPNLAPKAFTAGRLESMLNAGAKAYVTHPRGVSVSNGRVTASKIYDWFEEDFGGNEAGVLAHLRQHGAKGLGSATDISDYVYDWSLNGSDTAAG
jgi:hypothetical protein